MKLKNKWDWFLLLLLNLPLHAKADDLFIIQNDTLKYPILKSCEYPDSSYSAQLECTWEQFSRILESKLKYPGIALDNGEQGTAVIGFTISKDGTFSKPHVVREFAYGVAYDLDKKLERMQKKLELEWTPGSFNDTIKGIEFNVSVYFNIEKEKPAFKGFESIFCEEHPHFIKMRAGNKFIVKYLENYESSMDNLWCSQLFEKSFLNVELTYISPSGVVKAIPCQGEIIDEFRSLIPVIEKKGTLEIKYTRVTDLSKTMITKTIAIN